MAVNDGESWKLAHARGGNHSACRASCGCRCSESGLWVVVAREGGAWIRSFVGMEGMGSGVHTPDAPIFREVGGWPPSAWLWDVLVWVCVVWWYECKAVRMRPVCGWGVCELVYACDFESSECVSVRLEGAYAWDRDRMQHSVNTTCERVG
jgi:hypothetical protein